MNKLQNAKFITAVKVLIVTTCISCLTACGGGSAGSQAPDPTVVEKPIAYVKRPTPTDNGMLTGTPISGDVTDPEAFNPGAHLIVKLTAALDAQEIDVTNAIIGDTGDVRDPVFSDDGTKLLFALHKMTPNGATTPETWNIYEYDLTKPLSQTSGSENPWMLIQDDGTAGAGDDVEPAFMPNNQVMFSSTRASRVKSIEVDENTQQFSPTIEQVNSQRHAFNLHIMPNIPYGSASANTANAITQLTFNMSDDLYPTVIRDIPGLLGRVMFVRWEHSPGRNQLSLYTMKPDGSDVQILYGENSHNTGANNTTIEFTQPRETSNGNIVVLARQVTGTFDGGAPMLINVGQYVDNTVPVSASSGLTGPAQTVLSNNTVLTYPGISLGGRFNSIAPLMDGTNRALVSYSLCYVNVLDTATSTTQTRACNDPRVNLSDPNTTEAPPRYGIFVYNMDNNTVLPITAPEPNIYYTDVALAQDLTPVPYIPSTLDDYSANPYGIIDIRSVYDMDGSFDPMGSTATSLSQLADPAQSTTDKANNPTLIERPARFLRIVKGVYLPDNKIHKFKSTAYGVSSGQLMRQIIGYAPIDPDGSVRVKVPANVPLSISILDKNGRRIGNRHGNWLTVGPGETLSCNGCHNPASTAPHGRAAAAFPSINPGATADGAIFANTVATFLVNAGNTMAEARTQTASSTGTNPLLPTPDIVYSDVWTNPAIRAVDTAFSYNYADLKTPAPANAHCSPWDQSCRIVINYAADIQPIWEYASRVDAAGNPQVCTSCHHAPDGTNPPDGQLDLTNNPSAATADRFVSYQDLLATHDEVDKNGTVVTVDSGQVDANNQPIFVPVTVPRSMVAGSAASSTAFFNEFTNTNGVTTPHCTVDTNGVCQPWLSPAEFKLLSEWLDIGAQYYNNPFVAP